MSGSGNENDKTQTPTVEDQASGSGYKNDPAKTPTISEAKAKPSTRKEIHYIMKYDPSFEPETEFKKKVDASDLKGRAEMKATLKAQIEHQLVNWTYLNNAIAGNDDKPKDKKGEPFDVYVAFGNGTTPKKLSVSPSITIATLREDCCRLFDNIKKTKYRDAILYLRDSHITKDTCDGKSGITGEKLKMDNGSYIKIVPNEQITIRFD